MTGAQEKEKETKQVYIGDSFFFFLFHRRKTKSFLLNKKKTLLVKMLFGPRLSILFTPSPFWMAIICWQAEPRTLAQEEKGEKICRRKVSSI